jgi:hypothetical protein
MADAGRRDEALAAIQNTVQIRRQLTATQPACGSLHNTSHSSGPTPDGVTSLS